MNSKRAPINSTNITSVGYDEKNQLLEIEFRTGRIYRYSSVPPYIYAGLMKSTSHGKYFLTKISNVFAHVEVPR